jgi:opacity protein-like surface antigen
MKRILLILVATAGAAAGAGPFSIGIKAGVPLTDFLNGVSGGGTIGPGVNTSGPGGFFLNSGTNRYIIGGQAELRLPAGLGIEFDALFRHFDYNSSFSLVDVLTNNRATGNAWEFPLLVKYRFAAPLVKPYVDAGIAFDTLSGLSETIATTVAPGHTTTTSTSNPTELKNSTTEGFVIGVGVDIHAIIMHIQPEIRYTRWGSAHFAIPNGSSLSNQNQAEFLVGFTF